MSNLTCKEYTNIKSTTATFYVVNEMQNILYIGKFFPPKMLKIIKKYNGEHTGFTNHNFEMSIIDGLVCQNNIKLFCLSVPAIFSYPHNSKKIYAKPEKYIQDGAIFRSIGFCNLFIINKIWQVIALAASICNILKLSREKKIDIIVNTPDLYILTALKIVLSFFKVNISTTLIIPDIPSAINQITKSNSVKSIINRLVAKLSMSLAQNFDNYVLLTEAMTEFFKKDINYVIVEGLIDSHLVCNDNNSGDIPLQKKIILYTGTLVKVFGIINLIDAFERGKFINTELWICGSGNAKDQILERVRNNPNIKFLGLLNREQLIKIQSKATLLVNPRTSDGDYTKYSFPSKTIEYLLSGKVVIINRLPGIPLEYFDYVITPADESITELTKTINYVLSMDDETRNIIGKKGREFIINNKNSKIQVSKILKLINNY